MASRAKRHFWCMVCKALTYRASPAGLRETDSEQFDIDRFVRYRHLGNGRICEGHEPELAASLLRLECE